MRKVRQYIWVDPKDCIPPHGLDMESKRDYEKVERLTKEFKANGFDLNMPALVGYPLEDKIQLLSGTHRHLAAIKAGIKLPITLWLRSDVERMWGTELWVGLIDDIPVKKLEAMEVKDGFHIAPYDRVEL
jgi:hypothetical protein